jgi:hypothetical protein
VTTPRRSSLRRRWPLGPAALALVLFAWNLNAGGDILHALGRALLAGAAAAFAQSAATALVGRLVSPPPSPAAPTTPAGPPAGDALWETLLRRSSRNRNE